MATKKTVSSVPDSTNSESAKELETQMEQQDLLADIKGVLPAPEKLRIRHQNTLVKLQLELMPVFEKMYQRDEDGEVLRDSDGNALVAENSDKTEGFMALADMAAAVDEWAESVATDKDAYVEWAGGKSADYFLAILSYYRTTSGE